MRPDERIGQVLPPQMTEEETQMVRVAQRCIMEALDHSRAAAIVLTTDEGKHPKVELPPAALKLIGQVLGLMSKGEPIVLMPQKQELSTVEAAHFLNVSRPHLIKLLEAKEIPFRKVGTHRRILFEDMVAYRQRSMEARQLALDRLAYIDRELGLDE